jgi:S-DNA-T family DNA segregation ATPase FtsK/SpoIIIE
MIHSQKPHAKKTPRKNSAPQKEKTSFSLSSEIFGILYFTLAVFFILILISSAGPLGERINMFLSYAFGIGRYGIPLLLFGFSLSFFFAKSFQFHLLRNIGIFLFVSSLLGIIHVSAPQADMFSKASEYGGIVGFISVVFFRLLFSDTATYVLLIGTNLIAFLITFEISFSDIKHWFSPKEEESLITKKRKGGESEEDDFIDAEIEIIKPTTELQERKPLSLKKGGKEIEIQKPHKKESIEITDVSVSKNWKLPSLDLLTKDRDESYPSDDFLHKQAKNIQDKLNEFGIDVDMVNARVGPTVTQFTMSPKEGVPVKKIVSAKEDIALALAAKSIRIEAPIPGQPFVGLEIPNEKRSIVFMREILESEEFADTPSTLRLAIGKDVAGNAVVADLAKMPHLLIAGSTGSGKSVGMNAFLVSLLYQNSPADLKFIMIDPKRVELKGYNGIPHLLTPVITEADKALAALKWSVAEMMRRYEDLSNKGYRNLGEHNESEEEKIPNIVIVIDELADLMMRDFRKDTEAAICRLAQMARAVGMHLIVATQRPSVDVITGVIKANIPTRISFTVTSAVDSRTILDSIGAEDLLGQGDMLYIDANTPKPKRIQGIFLSSKEIEKVTNAIKLAREPDFHESNIDLSSKKEYENSLDIGVDLEAIAKASEEDELIPEAIEVLRSTGKASATLFQRTLSVGYARAAKLLDILENKGIVGPANGAKPREIFLERIGE